jgi:toxin YoeB
MRHRLPPSGTRTGSFTSTLTGCNRPQPPARGEVPVCRVRTQSAWEDYVWWRQQDRKVLNRINTDIQRNGNEGIGKPEPLKHGFQGYWSRRITDEYRLVTRSSRTRSA